MLGSRQSPDIVDTAECARLGLECRQAPVGRRRRARRPRSIGVGRHRRPAGRRARRRSWFDDLGRRDVAAGAARRFVGDGGELTRARRGDGDDGVVRPGLLRRARSRRGVARRPQAGRAQPAPHPQRRPDPGDAVHRATGDRPRRACCAHPDPAMPLPPRRRRALAPPIVEHWPATLGAWHARVGSSASRGRDTACLAPSIGD